MIQPVSQRPFVYRSFVVASLLFAAATGGVVIEIAGEPPPSVGTVGEDGPATEAALNNAEDVEVAPNGDIYIADFNSARLLRIRDGTLSVAYRGEANENDFAGVGIAPDGTVYFSTGLALLSLSPDGTIREVLPSDPGDQVWVPKVAVGADGTVYLSGGRQPRIDRIAPDGTVTLIAGADEPAAEPGIYDGDSALEARFSRITELVVDSQGVIYVSDEDFGDIHRIDPDGTITTIFGAGPINFPEAADGTRLADINYQSGELGIALDSSDDFYVMLRLDGRVWRVEDGAIVTVAGGGPNVGTGFLPLETAFVGGFRIAFTPDDELLILVEDGRFLYQAGAIVGAALVDSVPAPSDLNLDPLVVAATLALTGGMIFLIPFPAEIFNNTLAEHHDQIRAWFRRRREATQSKFWETSGGVVLALFIMTLLYGFLDPGFGINATSLPTFVGLLIGVAMTTLGFALPTLLIRRRRAGSWGRWRALPVALLVGVGCVILSRLIGFVPGYLYGMVLALGFATEIGEDAETTEVTVTALVLLGLAFTAWFGLGAVRAGTSSGVSETVEAALAMTTVAAFEGLVFGLLPIHGMPGRILFQRRRRRWALIWGVAVLAFFHVLVNPQSGYLVNTAIVPVATTYGLLALFTVISLALWAWFRRRSVSR